MRSSLQPATAATRLARSPSPREQAHRFRWAMAGGLCALALAGGLVGFLGAPRSSLEPDTRTGPFSYFPSE